MSPHLSNGMREEHAFSEAAQLILTERLALANPHATGAEVADSRTIRGRTRQCILVPTVLRENPPCATLCVARADAERGNQGRRLAIAERRQVLPGAGRSSDGRLWAGSGAGM